MRTYFNTVSKIYCVTNTPVDIWENSSKIKKWDSTPNEIRNYLQGKIVWKEEKEND